MRVARRPVTPLLALAALLVAGCASQQPPQRSVAAAPAPVAPQTAGPRSVDLSGPVTVALLSPRSAGQAEIQAAAADIEAAARIAAAESPTASIDLRVHDTAGAGGSAASAADAAIAGGAAVIVGPAFSDTTQAVGPAARRAGVTVLSFSSDMQAAGDGVWVLGDLPENEADRILAHAAARGAQGVALVRPRTPYGDLAERAARAAGGRHGVTLTDVVAYDRSFEGVQQAITDAAPALRSSPADTVLIADTGQALSIVAAFLDFNEVSPRDRRFVGLSGWRAPETLQEPSLRGGLFAGVDPDAGASFTAKFLAETGRAPHPRAWLGYDAVKAVAAMIEDARAAGDATPFDAAAVTRAGGFDGARGRFALRGDGGNRRALSVFQVTADGFEVVDGAPVGAGL